MQIIPISKLGEAGLIADIPFSELPLNAWTDVKNMRFRDGAVEKFLGHAAQLGAPLYVPQWLQSVNQGGSAFWLYASAERVGATDGASHVDITRELGGLYTVNPSTGWTGTIIEDIPVINNGIDAPQMWRKPSLGQKLQRLTAWPTNYTCSSMFGLKRYLVALDVSKTGVRFPTMVKWSHQAPSGDVPQSWNENDETLDAGEYTLPGDGGFLVDGCSLRDGAILYKEYQTWGMQYVGGVEIFRFSKIFDSVGAISRRSAIEFFSGKQLVFTGDDVVVHDGHEALSIVSSKIRTLITQLLDVQNYTKAFVTANFASSEVWVCIPTAGQASCTLAFIWNWLTNTWGVRELPNVLHISNGIVNPQSAGETWDGDTQVWDLDTTTWGDRTSDPTKRKMLMATATLKLYTPGVSPQFDGADVQAYAERRGMGFPTRPDQLAPNYTRYKQVLGLWPRISGTSGGSVLVSLGTQERVDSPVNWHATRTYKIGTNDMLDFAGSPASKIHALKFESRGNVLWRLHGYDVEIVDRGQGR